MQSFALTSWFARGTAWASISKNKLANVARSRGAPDGWARDCLKRPPERELTDTPICWRNGRQNGRREPSDARLGPRRLSPLSSTSPIRSIVRRSRCSHSSPLASAGCFGAELRTGDSRSTFEARAHSRVMRLCPFVAQMRSADRAQKCLLDIPRTSRNRRV
jgi:hypothetical protein